MTGKRTLREVWPNLMTATVGGVNPDPYLRELSRLILGNANDSEFFFSEVYNGTEGFYALQIDEGDMVLMPDANIFYEFVRREEAAAGNYSNLVPLAGVEIGVDYAPVISSIHGLWRYLIGDTVRFTAKDPYRVIVSGRVQQYLNITGEELLVDTAEVAIQSVCADYNLTLVDYTATALKLEGIRDNARHLWLVEVTDPQGIAPQTFAGVLDRTLIEAHYDYAKSRSSGLRTGESFGLAPPQVVLLPPGTFRRWLHNRLDGRISAQSKVPRLSMDVTVVQELLEMVESEMQ
jgi:hypothetical protein